MNEVWKTINGYENYQVSNLGNVKSFKLLKPVNSKKGYLYISLCKNGIVNKTLIHRLVANAFISNPENKPQVNHINGVKSDNRVCNLEWCNNSENQLHSYNELNVKTAGKKCKCIETNKIYDSAKDAAFDVGLSIDAVAQVCRGEKLRAGGLHWCYI